MKEFLLVSEIISVKGSVESYVPSVTICNTKKIQEWDNEQVQKLPKINVKVQDFFEHVPVASELE